MIHPVYELHRDEYLHLDQGLHPAWGFISVPPVTSWVASLIHLAGGGEFWVRFFPALFGAFTIYIVWKATEALGGKLFAQVLAAVAVMFSAVFRLNLLFQPNSLDILLWTILFFIVIKYVQTDHIKWLYAAGVVMAVGFLNKYNIIFLMLGLFAAIAITRHRKIFLIKEFWFSMLLSLLIILPNLVWQFNNSWPVIHHMNELAETQLVNMKRSDFLAEQLMFFLGSVYVLITGIISAWFYKPFREFRLLVIAFLITFLLFVFFKAKGYYAIGLYPIFMAFGATYLERILKWKALRVVAIVLPVILFVPVATLVFPYFSPENIIKKNETYRNLGMLRWEDGKDHSLPQDFADMLGWKELASIVDSAVILSGENTLVLADNYGQAGAINYYSRLPEMKAVSYNADYINWFPKGKFNNVVLIKDETDRDTTRSKEKGEFESVRLIGRIQDKYAREKGTAVFLMINKKNYK